jgi:PAS domain S-box-containing protein
MEKTTPSDQLENAVCVAALSAIADGVIVTDADALITFMNSAAEKLTGWTQKEALKKPLREVFNIVDERLRSPVENPVPRAIREGAITGLAGHTVLIARDKNQWAIDDSAAPIRDDTGKIVGVVLTFRDVTHRRRAEKGLEVSEIRYRRLFEAAHDGILILNAETGKVVDVNRFLLDLLQYPMEHFLGKQLWEIGVFHDAEASKAAMATLQERGSIRYEDLPLEDKNGLCIPVEFVSNVYREGNQNVIQCNIRDITERRRTEKELQKAKLAAEAANRAKSEFLANMSHEIRTPMTAIMGFADMILHENQDEAGRKECVQVIRRNGSNLLELINGILDLSKIEEGHMTVERVRCDVPTLLADLISLVRPRAVEKGLEFEAIFTCPIPRFIQTDPMRLQQILVNLLGNAIKFTATGKITMKLCVQGSEPNHELCFEIVDTGIGMNPEQLSRLFKPFSQADESITRKFGGTGLGLTISRQLAHLLGGEVQVKSELDVGTSFTACINGGSLENVEMLTHLDEASLPSSAPTDDWQNIPLNGRILLAEDGKDNQRLLSTHLRACGAEVIIADNGQIAVDLVAKDPFALILMDMQMPIMDGYTAAKELRRAGCTTPIIALTAYAMAEDRKKCIDCGCSDYLSKPIDRQILLKTASKYMEKSAATLPARAPPNPASTTTAGPIKSTMMTQPGMLEIITQFVEGLPAEVKKMSDSLEKNDMNSLRKVVHQLRGAAGGYGFTPITAPAASAEASITASRDLKSITMEIESLIAMVRRIEGYDESKLVAAN